MSTDLMSEIEALKLHFAGLTKTQEFTFFSGFSGALRDARKFTRRNQDNGVKLNGENLGDLGSWLGTIGYLALLDQIGKCFKPKSARHIAGNSITKALKYFTKLPDKDIDAIYALRCGFAHDFSLFNVNQKNPSLTHFFLVHKGVDGPLVQLPQVQWDGNHLNRTGKNMTIVNLELLGDMVEEIVKNLTQIADSGGLEVTLPGGSDELIRRYSFYTRSK
jgi:hypothetical protein